MPSFEDIIDLKISDYESITEQESGRNDDRFIALFSLYALKDFKSGGSGGGIGGNLTTWSGSTNLSTLGIVSTGTWNADTIAPQYGGTGLNVLGSANQQLKVNASGTGLEYFTPVDGNSVTLNGQVGAFYLSRSNHTGTQPWSTITGTPTTLAGYGIADAVSSSSTIPTNRGGTGLTSIGTAGQVLRVNAGATGLEYFTAPNGTVTSVGLTLPNIFAVTNSPVTSTGTLTASLTSQTAGTVLAAPSGGNGVPSFRALTASDIPSGVDAIKIGNGDVNNSTLSLLAGVTSSVQTQLNNKQPLNSNLTTLSTPGTALQQVRVNSAGTQLEYFTPSGDAVTLNSQSASFYLNRANHTGTQAWSTITGTPTTLSGYGVTDGVSNSLPSAQIWVGDATDMAVARSLSGAITVSNTGVTTLSDNAVTNVHIRNSAGSSVIGRSSSASGDPADIIAGSNFTVLRRGNAAGITFGRLDSNYIDLVDADRLLGSTTTSGTASEIPCTAFARSLLDDVDAATARATLKISANSGSVCDGRLTLASGTPDTSGTNIIGATTIFFTPYLGNLIALYNTAEARWELHSFSELSLPLAGTAANTNYDVFIWDNAGTLTLEWVAWASSGAGTSTRATAITRLNGTWVKSTDNRRYLGSFRTTSAGQTEDSETGTPKCFLQNCSNRVVRTLSRNDATASWTYSGTSFRATNNSTLNRVEVINGSESMIKASYYQLISSGLDYRVGIGVNSTTETSSLISPLMFNSAASSPVQGTTVFEGALSTGFNYLQMLERAVSGSGIVYGTIALGRSGMIVDYWA